MGIGVGTVHVGINDLRHGVQRAGVLRHVIEQAKVRVEDFAHVHDEQDDNHRADAGQGNILHLLPLGRAVHRRRFVQRSINAGNGREVQHGGIADILPHAAQGQDQGPIGGIVVEVGWLDAHTLLQSGDHAAGGVKERHNEVACHYPAEEVREEHHGLVSLGGEAVSQLAHHDGEGHGNDQSQHDPQQVIAQRVADHDRRIRGFQKLEVLQSHPVALDDVIPEGVRLERPVVLESDHNAEHRQVTDQQQPDSSRRDHGH